MFTSRAAYCPVGNERLGLIVKGEVCSFVCKDCEFIYTWDKQGKLLVPVKLKPHKDTRCGCNSCGR